MVSRLRRWSRLRSIPESTGFDEDVEIAPEVDDWDLVADDKVIINPYDEKVKGGCNLGGKNQRGRRSQQNHRDHFH